MPELPEVETIRRHLERRIVGRTVARLWLSGHALRRPVPKALVREAPGQTVRAVERHGKFLIVAFTSHARLLAHLGMTGSFRFHERTPKRVPPHTHAGFEFTDGSVLHYQDTRRFGLLDWCDEDAVPARLGPPGRGVDPTRERLDAESLARAFRASRAPIKHVLLDQARIAGLGNIYACEALYRAGIGPRRRTHTLGREERARLAGEIHEVLECAIESGGTTFSDFRDVDDQPGRYATALLVYDREGEPCSRCGKAIRRIVQSGRSTFWCAGCQRRGGTRLPATRSPGRHGR